MKGKVLPNSKACFTVLNPLNIFFDPYSADTQNINLATLKINVII